eukprot:6179450-Pleurochrysis_carterae.AAC.1
MHAAASPRGRLFLPPALLPAGILQSQPLSAQPRHRPLQTQARSHSSSETALSIRSFRWPCVHLHERALRAGPSAVAAARTGETKGPLRRPSPPPCEALGPAVQAQTRQTIWKRTEPVLAARPSRAAEQLATHQSCTASIGAQQRLSQSGYAWKVLRNANARMRRQTA